MKTMNGKFQLAAQHGKRGYFGSIEIEVLADSTLRGIAVEFACQEIEWRTGVLFGLTYAYNKTIGMGPNSIGATVKVLELQGHAVDTTEIVMAFVSARAFFSAVDAPIPEGLALDRAAGSFVFPK